MLAVKEEPLVRAEDVEQFQEQGYLVVEKRPAQGGR